MLDENSEIEVKETLAPKKDATTKLINRVDLPKIQKLQASNIGEVLQNFCFPWSSVIEIMERKTMSETPMKMLKRRPTNLAKKQGIRNISR